MAQQRRTQFLQWAVDRSGDALTALGQQRGGMALPASISSHTLPEMFRTLPVDLQLTEGLETLLPYAWSGQLKPTTLRTRSCCSSGCERWERGLMLASAMTSEQPFQNTQILRMPTQRLETRSSLGDALEFRFTMFFQADRMKTTSLYLPELPTSCRSCNA